MGEQYSRMKKRTANSKAPGITSEEILAGHSKAVQRLTQKLRRLVRSEIPAAQERAQRGWHAIGYHHPKAGYFCGLFPFDDHVKLLFEWGAFLPDPDGVLEGQTRRVRYVMIRNERTIPIAAIKRLLHTATTRD